MKHFCGLILTKVVAIFGGQGKIWKNQEYWNIAVFDRKQISRTCFCVEFCQEKVLHLWKNNFCSCFSPKMSWKNETFLPEFKLKACSQYLLSVKNSNISVFLIFSNFTLSPQNSHNFGQNQPTEMFHPSLESWDQGQ